MTYLTNLQQEYRFWPDPQTVSLEARRHAGNTNDDFVAAALQMDLNKARSTFGGVMLTGDERAWLLPDVLLINTTEILEGDRIYEAVTANRIAATRFWIINKVRLVRFNTQWAITAVKDS